MRNHTVKARYIKLQIFATNAVAIDEVSIFGSDIEVSEPDYNFSEENVAAHTDVLNGISMKINGDTDTTELTDTNFTKGVQVSVVDNKTVVECEVDAGLLMNGALSGASIFMPDAAYEKLAEASVFLAFDNKEYEKAATFDDSFKHSIAGLTSLNTYFNLALENPAKVKFEFILSSEATQDEFELSGLQLYCGNPQQPIIKGGFYGFFIDYIEGYNKHHFFDEYRIYLLLKGYKELGMQYIVAPNNMEYENKKVLAEPSEALIAKGYVKTSGHGVYDVNEAILKACDKLQMKCFISTLISSTYTEIEGLPDDKNDYYLEVVDDAELLINNLYNKYQAHSSFYGFYLTDETCDYWMSFNNKKGTEVYRTLYEGQSKIIRELDKNLKIMIAPAAWRSDTPANFAVNMYNMIKPETEGELPVVDIVAMQDCLGREATLTVPSSVYAKYEEYLGAVSQAVKNAGAEFFNDAEVFDVGYKAKRFEDTINSLNLEYK